MKLKEYLGKNSIRYRPFAKDLGIAEQTLRSIMAGIRRPGLVLALKIEELTKGEITPQQLVQDFQKLSEEKARKKIEKKCDANATQMRRKLVGQNQLTPRQQKIYRFISTRNQTTKREITSLLDLSKDTALRELHRLIELGLVTKSGIGKATVYRNQS